jgi:hypothetical protein
MLSTGVAVEADGGLQRTPGVIQTGCGTGLLGTCDCVERKYIAAPVINSATPSKQD